jgi:DNA-binding PadR family transcriptional regulator
MRRVLYQVSTYSKPTTRRDTRSMTAITTDVTEQVGVTLGAGTLYAALTRLEERGLIEGPPPEGRRRPYRLTAAGAAELSAQASRMPRLAALSLGRLRLDPA